MSKVLVVMGSDSDFPVMEGCFKMLKKFGIEFEANVCSAHRTPEKAISSLRKPRITVFLSSLPLQALQHIWAVFWQPIRCFLL